MLERASEGAPTKHESCHSSPRKCWTADGRDVLGSCHHVHDTIDSMVRSRRRTAKWIVTSAAVALLILTIASIWFEAEWDGHGGFGVSIGRGVVDIDWRAGGPLETTTQPNLVGVLVQNVYGPMLWLPAYERYVSLRDGCTYSTVTIPTWIPLLALGLLTVRLWVIGRRLKIGCCIKCGYDMSGLGTGACPECSQAQPAPVSRSTP